MAEPDMETEREALVLFDDLLDIPETKQESWIADRTSNVRVKARLQAMLEADRIASLRTGAAALGLGAAPLPERIGHYRITGLIGRGGMGAVYRGVRDAGDFAHEAAIKVIKPGLLSDVLTQRFLAERQTLAGLSHPNIARLYDGGSTEGGSPTIVMELIDGLPIDRWADSQGLDVEERLKLVETAAAAIAHAHQRLVIHRDITPLNVLVQNDGTLKLIDFGIARPAGGGGEVTTAVDIAGLGRLARRLVPEPPPELAAVIAKATDPEEARRYPTAEALGEDLKAYRLGLPVSAMPPSRRYRVGKFVARHRGAVLASGAALLLLVGALVAVLFANAAARRAEQEAEARFEQTRGIANALLFDVFDEVSKVTGSTEARRILATTALSYLDALAGMENAPTELRIEAGLGYVRLSEVMGGGQAAQLGRYADAAALLAKAEMLLAPIYAADPSSRAAAEAYATLRLEQAGTSLYNSNDAALARIQAGEAEKATASFSTAGTVPARLHAVAIQTLADSHGWNDEWEPALAQHLRAERFIASLPAELKKASEVRSARSANLRLLGEAHHKLKQAPEAKAALAQAVAINRQLLAEAPDDPKVLRKLTTSLWYSAVVHRTNMRDAEARAAIEEAVVLARQLAARDPADAGGVQMVAITGEVMAQVYADIGDKAQSFAASNEVIATHRKLVGLAGNAPGARRSMATALATQGGNAYQLGDMGAACASWRETRAMFEALDKTGELSESDRKNGLPEVRSYIADYCEGGKPRSSWPAAL